MTRPRPRIYAAPRQWVITLIAMFLGILIAVTTNIIYTNRVDQESNQAWCDIINSLDERYRALPADAAPEAHTFAIQIAALKKHHKC